MPRTDAQLSCPLANLPAELVDGILAFLSPVDLVAISQTCRALRKHAISDALWQPLVQENVPGVRLRSPYPFKSYRELYSTHDPKWFLPKYKVWFCDRDLVGKLIIVRYDQRRGCIEGHQLVAVSNHTHHQNWSENHHVIIHAFEPRVMLHEDKPVIKFSATINPESSRAHELMGGKRGFQAEVPMIIDENPNNMHCNLLLTRPLESQAITQNARRPFPYGHLWPPPAIPSRQHVTGTPAFNDEHHLLARPELPTSRAESSDVTFRIRQWIHMGGSPPTRLIYGQGLETLMQTLTGQVTPPRGPGTGSHLVDFPGLTSVNLGEEVITYSTLDPALYTPTDLKPWRGIWVGDYSAHGCEFLLIHQPDDVVATDEDLGLVRSEGEPEAAWEKRRRDARIYRGRLEAIKLTGDPNIPRGEYTFVAEDLGLGGFVGVAEEHPFYGARVVRSQGHIARSGFQGGQLVFFALVRTHLIMVKC